MGHQIYALINKVAKENIVGNIPHFNWYKDYRGFTPAGDQLPGKLDINVEELLSGFFEHIETSARV